MKDIDDEILARLDMASVEEIANRVRESFRTTGGTNESDKPASFGKNVPIREVVMYILGLKAKQSLATGAAIRKLAKAKRTRLEETEEDIGI